MLTTFLVDSTADAGAGTLRQAILDANANAGPDSIEFDIAGGGVNTITLAAALPDITDTVIIDATTEPDFAGTPVVELNGNGVTGDGLSFVAGSNGSQVRGLVVNRFDGHGIFVFSADDLLITGNYIGTNAAGTGALGNTGHGIRIANAANTVIGGTTAAERNIISGNAQQGIDVSGALATNNTILGNYIGVDSSGNADLGNDGHGVRNWLDATGNTIGGAAAGAGNVISGNAFAGIALGELTDAGGNLVEGNIIGLNDDGDTAIPNSTGAGSGGIAIASSNNTIRGNVISGNQAQGILFSSLNDLANDNLIVGNFIGTDASGLVAVGASGRGIFLQQGAHDNVIGGTTAADRNVISGNSDGIFVNSATVSGTVIQGNYVGLGADGATDIGNLFQGIYVADSSATIGGDAPGAGNVISANGGDGVRIEGAGNGLPEGIVSWWRADGDATDFAGSNDGTLVNGTTFAAGQNGQAFSFDGVDDYVQLPLDSAITSLTTGTLDFWVQIPDLAANTVRLFGFGQSGVAFPNADQWAVDYRFNGNIEVSAFTGGVRHTSAYTPPNTIADNDFHHVAVVADGVGPIEIYVDGVNQPLGEIDGQPTTFTADRFLGHAVAADTMLIGALQRDQLFAEGSKLIDELGIYDRALTSTEIANLFAAGGAAKGGSVVQGNIIGLDAGGTVDLGNAGDGIEIANSPLNLVGGPEAYLTSVLDDSPLIYYRLGETTGASSAANLGSLGAAATGTYQGNVGLGTPGAVEGGWDTAASFGSTNTDYVITNPVNFPTTALTVEFWMNSSTPGTVSAPFSYATSDGENEFLISHFNGQFNLFVNDNTGSIGPTGIATGVTAYDGEWHHIVVAWQSSDGALSLYKDGALEFSGTLQTGNPLSSGGSLVLAQEQDAVGGGLDPAQRFIGALDEVAVYGTVLTDDDVAAHYASSQLRHTNIISGNGIDGVQIINSASVGNTIQGNIIGLDITGTVDLGNSRNGVLINSSFNIVGGTNSAARNIISGNQSFGVALDSGAARNNQVLGNYIGTDESGNLNRGNSSAGVFINGGSDNVIGAPNAGNVISGNGNRGVVVAQSGARGNVVQSNIIGLDAAGSAPLGNAVYGVHLQNASATIGGDGPGEGNVISANFNDGIHIEGVGNGLPDGIVSWWRADGDATDFVGGNDGTISNGAGFAAGQNGQGFDFDAPIGGANEDRIEIPDDPSLDLTLLTIEAWIKVDSLPTGGSSVIVGKGVTASSDNYELLVNENQELQFFSYNAGFHGVTATGSGITLGQFHHVAATVDGSTVRLYVDGQLVHEQAQAAPLVPNNGPLLIGTLEPHFANRFDGVIDELAIYNRPLSGGEIVRLFAAGGLAKGGSVVEGNIIGLDASGAIDRGNGDDGIELNGSPLNLIGGSTTDARNVISGNNANGVLFTGALAAGNVLQANYIGTDVTGAVALRNGTLFAHADVRIDGGASQNLIGTNADGLSDEFERNVISGSAAGVGVYIVEAGSEQNIIAGNYVGTDASGMNPLGALHQGVRIEQAANNLVGGTSPEAGNVISGNRSSGIALLSAGATGNQIQGNLIGLAADGATLRR